MSATTRFRPDFHRPSWRSLVQYYRAQFACDISINLAYRASVLIWVLSTIVQPLVSIVVWQTVAASDEYGGGITAGQYAAYFMITMLVNHLTFIWHMWEFEWRIRTGYFSPLLLRPIHPIHHDISQNLSYKVVGLAGVIPGMVLLALVFDADFGSTGVGDIVAFVPALILAMGLRFILEWSLALAAFWLTKVSAINAAFDVFFMFLGGQFAPLAIMPAWIRVLANVLPFRWAIAFPVEVALGQHTGGEIALGYLAQIAWIAIAVVILRTLWSRATARYSAVGA